MQICYVKKTMIFLFLVPALFSIFNLNAVDLIYGTAYYLQHAYSGEYLNFINASYNTISPISVTQKDQQSAPKWIIQDQTGTASKNGTPVKSGDTVTIRIQGTAWANKLLAGSAKYSILCDQYQAMLQSNAYYSTWQILGFAENCNPDIYYPNTGSTPITAGTVLTTATKIRLHNTVQPSNYCLMAGVYWYTVTGASGAQRTTYPSELEGYGEARIIYMGYAGLRSAGWLFVQSLADQAAAQAAEIQRVQNILNTLPTSFLDRFTVLKNLAASIIYVYDYTSVQLAFLTAVNNLHSIRPTADKTALQNLQAWYGVLGSSKLLPAGATFAQQINDITSNITNIDQTAAQTAEMTRVQGILNGLSGKTFAEQFAALQALAASVVNQSFDYSSVQAAFISALTNLQSARPMTDKTALQNLQTLYGTLGNSKLVPTGITFTQQINDVIANISSIDQAAAALAAQAAEMVRVQGVLNGLGGKTFAEQFAALQALAASVANQNYDYSSVQAAFMSALTNLQNSRPITDKMGLQNLQAWYGALGNSKLLPAGTTFTQQINDITANITSIDQTSAQAAEMARIKSVLTGISGKDLSGQITDLQKLVKSVATNSQSNPTWDYSSLLQDLLAAINSLQAKIASANLSQLQALQSLNSDLSSSKLSSPVLQTQITNINIIVTTKVTELTQATQATTTSIDAQVVAAINVAMSKVVIDAKTKMVKSGDAVAAMNLLNNVVKTYAKKTVKAATQNTFSLALMSVAGNYILSKSADTFYSTMKTKLKKPKTLTANDKKNIALFNKIVSTFKSLLTNSSSAGCLLLSNTQKTYCKNTLIKKLGKLKL